MHVFVGPVCKCIARAHVCVMHCSAVRDCARGLEDDVLLLLCVVLLQCTVAVAVVGVSLCKRRLMLLVLFLLLLPLLFAAAPRYNRGGLHRLSWKSRQIVNTRDVMSCSPNELCMRAVCPCHSRTSISWKPCFQELSVRAECSGFLRAVHFCDWPLWKSA